MNLSCGTQDLWRSLQHLGSCHCSMWDLVPWAESNPDALCGEHGGLATWPPEKSFSSVLVKPLFSPSGPQLLCPKGQVLALVITEAAETAGWWGRLPPWVRGSLLVLVSMRDPLETGQGALQGSRHSRGGLWRADSSAGLNGSRSSGFAVLLIDFDIVFEGFLHVKGQIMFTH